MSLLERWVSNLERGTSEPQVAAPVSRSEPSRTPAARSPAASSPRVSQGTDREVFGASDGEGAGPLRSREEDDSLPPGSEPFVIPKPRVNRTENRPTRQGPDPFAEPPTRPSAPREPPASPFRGAREEIRVQGQVVTFPDGARIILANEGGRPVHRGTVAMRGPCAPSREDFAELGMSGAHARALEFVLSWFGAPFDSVSWASQAAGELRWGAWPLAGPTLVAALARWKRRDADLFEARLGRLGLEVTSEPASLRLHGVRSGATSDGRQALALLGEDPRLLAALAQAGRERGAQLAQLAALNAEVLGPLLPAGDGEAADGPFTTARALALLFHAELRLGRRGVTRLVAYARERSLDEAGERLAEDLRSAGRSREASEVWRVLSTPELSDAS
jgi:hypothetical protein